jgi:hypothetical protein
MTYYFYARVDRFKEPVSKVHAFSRLGAAKWFSYRKGLDLKSFLAVYSVSR